MTDTISTILHALRIGIGCGILTSGVVQLTRLVRLGVFPPPYPIPDSVQDHFDPILWAQSVVVASGVFLLEMR